MEVRDGVLCMGEEICSNPGGGVISVLKTFPSDQVPESALQPVIDSGVQDLRDLVLILVVDLDRRRGFDFTVGNITGLVRFELGDVEDGMDTAHIGRELEGYGMGAGASDDFVGTEILLRKFLRRSAGFDELCEEENFGSDRKLRSRNPLAVCGNLVTFLSFSNRVLDLRMKNIEVGDKLAGPVGSDFLVQGRGNVRVVAFVRKERGDTSGIIDGVVVCELGHREERRPVVLLVGAEDTEDLFEGLVNSLSLSVGFRVISGGEVQVHIQCFSEGPEEDRNKLGAAVGSNVSWYTMFGKDISNEEFSEGGGVNRVCSGDEDGLLREPINDD